MMVLIRHKITTDELNQEVKDSEVSISQKRKRKGKRKKKVTEKLNVGLGGEDDNIEANLS